MQANFCRSLMPGMVPSSTHQAGVPGCHACHSSHVSTSAMEDSGRAVCLFPFRALLDFRITEGHPPLGWRFIGGPRAYILKVTMGMTSTIGSGMISWPTSGANSGLTSTSAAGMILQSFPLLPAKPCEVTLEGFSSVQHPLAGHPKSCFIGFLSAWSNPPPFLKVHISSCSGICLPMHSIHQGGEYILNGPSPLPFSTGGEP